MTAMLQITTGRAPDGRPQLTAIGEIDLGNADELRRALADAVSPDQRLLVDLTRVDSTAPRWPPCSARPTTSTSTSRR